MSGTNSPKKKKKKSKKKPLAKLDKKKVDSNDLINSLSGVPLDAESPVSPTHKGGREERWGQWAQADIEPIRVRGKGYREDKKKSSRFRLLL